MKHGITETSKQPEIFKYLRKQTNPLYISYNQLASQTSDDDDNNNNNNTFILSL